MTCIVSLKTEDKIYIAADSAASSGTSISVRLDPKVFSNGKLLIGFSGSFRLGQLLRYGFKPPAHKDGKSDHEYLCTDVVKKLHKTLETHGFDGHNKKQEKETDGQFLIAYNGTVYEIYQDFQVGIPSTDYCAIGCGTDLALGAMFALEAAKVDIEPEEKLAMALRAASTYSSAVLPPYNILSVKV